MVSQVVNILPDVSNVSMMSCCLNVQASGGVVGGVVGGIVGGGVAEPPGVATHIALARSGSLMSPGIAKKPL